MEERLDDIVMDGVKAEDDGHDDDELAGGGSGVEDDSVTRVSERLALPLPLPLSDGCC
jgi:hypothetical protein